MASTAAERQPILLIEAARVINCIKSKRLAAELLLEIGIHDSELCLAYPADFSL